MPGRASACPVTRTRCGRDHRHGRAATDRTHRGRRRAAFVGARGRGAHAPPLPLSAPAGHRGRRARGRATGRGRPRGLARHDGDGRPRGGRRGRRGTGGRGDARRRCRGGGRAGSRGALRPGPAGRGPRAHPADRPAARGRRLDRGRTDPGAADRPGVRQGRRDPGGRAPHPPGDPAAHPCGRLRGAGGPGERERVLAHPHLRSPRLGRARLDRPAGPRRRGLGRRARPLLGPRPGRRPHDAR